MKIQKIFQAPKGNGICRQVRAAKHNAAVEQRKSAAIILGTLLPARMGLGLLDVSNTLANISIILLALFWSKINPTDAKIVNRAYYRKDLLEDSQEYKDIKERAKKIYKK